MSDLMGVNDWDREVRLALLKILEDEVEFSNFCSTGSISFNRDYPRVTFEIAIIVTDENRDKIFRVLETLCNR